MARIDIARVGGLTPAMAIRDACLAAKIPVGVEGARVGAVSVVANLALATSCDLRMSVTYGGAQASSGNFVQISDNVSAPGLRVDTEALALAAIEQATIR
jgi:L-alanine-DL-glutamate epimerase-like enolase superfamily enzyme